MYDFVSYQLPVREYARAEMLAGRFPLWVSYLGCGLPLHAGQQASLCHPLLTPLVLACGAEYGLKLCLFLHLALAYAGMYLLARYYKCSRAASGIAGLVATWSGFVINHLMAGHLPLVIQYALVPWFYLALSATLHRPGALRSLALAVVAACMALSGHPQVFYYTLLFGAAWATGSLLAGTAARARLPTIGWIVAAAFTCVLTAGIQMVPSWELARQGLSQSFRNGPDFPFQYALTGLDVVRLLFPNVAGNPFLGQLASAPGDNFHERVVYLGLAPPIVALAGLGCPGVARWQWGAACLVVVALAISLGDSTPVLSWLLTCVPGLAMVRCPGRVFAVASVLVALLTARGVDNLTARVRGGPDWLGLSALVWCATSMVAWPLLNDRHVVNFRFVCEHRGGDAIMFSALAIATLIVLLIVTRLGWRCPRGGCALLLGLIAVDLAWNNVRNFHLEPLNRVTLSASLVARGLPNRFIEGPISSYVSVDQLHYSRLVAAALAARRSLVGTNEGGVLPAATERLFQQVRAAPRIALAVAGCDLTCAPLDGECEPLGGALPRMRFATGVAAALCDRPIEDLSKDDLTTMMDEVLNNSPTHAAHHHAERNGYGDGRVRVAMDEPQRIVVRVDAPADGVLVVADTWYTGWTSEVDGQPVDLRPAHGVFRAVNVPAGHHDVVFEFQPLSFRLGAVGSVLGLALAAVLGIVGLRKKTK
jgi:hypothetical protein